MENCLIDQKNDEEKREISMRNCSSNDRQGQDCFICFRFVDKDDYENHVHACAAQLDQQIKQSSSNTKCFQW